MRQHGYRTLHGIDTPPQIRRYLRGVESCYVVNCGERTCARTRLEEDLIGGDILQPGPGRLHLAGPQLPTEPH